MLGMLLVGVAAAFLRHPVLGTFVARVSRSSLAAVGLMIGGGSIVYDLGLAQLPVSVAATLSNTYIVLPVVLATAVLHDHVTALKIGGPLAILAGAALLALPPL
jgi:drug/metabolite transporter (DMT)-like permease